MSRRNFPDFLRAYEQYASDGFCPDEFHIWTGLSMIAACLERKVWLEQRIKRSSICHYPNIYVLLVAHPGMGKSTAMSRGISLIETLKAEKYPELRIIPTQTTEAALVELMEPPQSVEIFPGVVHQHSSGFFYASEASNSSLQDIYGTFNNTITGFYDCDPVFRKKLKGQSRMSEIKNICFNLVAASTFDYLKTLVDENSVMGGFASRLIYVISKERKVRESKWSEEASGPPDRTMEIKLIEDLHSIAQTKGRFNPTKGFIKRWEVAKPNFDRYLIGLGSSRMESLMARKFTNYTKIAMLLSVSDRTDLVITEEHWDRAVDLVDSVTKHNSSILTSALIAKKDTQEGLNTFILNAIEERGGEVGLKEFRRLLSRYGADPTRADATIEMMIKADMIRSITDESGVTKLGLLVDAESNL